MSVDAQTMRVNFSGPSRVALCVVAFALAGCGSGSSPKAVLSPSGVPTSSAPTSASTSPGSNTITMTATAASTGGATNIAISNQVRDELIAAGAKARGLTSKDFTSLRKGMTYYAYDPATQTYWAGGELVPSSSSYRAQVSSQDDGGYTLFSKKGSGAWSAMDEGMAGPNSEPGNAGCRLTPPPRVLALWGWPANSCHPNGV